MLSFYLAMLDTEEDKTKFAYVYTTYEQTMFKVAKRILKDDARAEEAVGRAFEKIADNIERIFEIECHKIEGFVVNIVRNTAIEMYRRKKPKNAISLDEVDYCLCESDCENAIETKLDVQAVLNLLSPDYREVLLLKYYQGFGYDEIAKLLDISPDNVRQRILRARHRAQKIIEEIEETANANR